MIFYPVFTVRCKVSRPQKTCSSHIRQGAFNVDIALLSKKVLSRVRSRRGDSLHSTAIGGQHVSF